MKEEPIVKLNGTEFSPSEGETLKQQVLRYFMSQGGEANCSFGKVKLDNKGIKNDIAHPNYLNKTHAFAAIKDVLEKGKITTPFDYHEVHGKKQPTGIISGYIMIAEQPFKMDVTVIGNAGGELRLYCHDVYPIPIIENHQKSIITNYVLEKSKRQLSRNSFGDGTKITKIIESKNYKNMKKVQRINESQLRAIVAESVKKVLREGIEEQWGLDITYHGGTSVAEPQGAGSYDEMLKLAQHKIESEPDIKDIRIFKIEGGDSEGWGAHSTTIDNIKGQDKNVGGFNDPSFRRYYRKEYSSQN